MLMIGIVLMGTKYSGSIGCEVGREKDNHGLNVPGVPLTSSGGCVEFFASGKNSSSDYEQLDDMFDSTRIAVYDIEPQLHPGPLSVSQSFQHLSCKTRFVKLTNTMLFVE